MSSPDPYIPAEKSLTELTIGAIILGCALGLVFAASSVYLALKVGLTVSASIPIAVLSITIFRAFTRAMMKAVRDEVDDLASLLGLSSVEYAARR